MRNLAVATILFMIVMASAAAAEEISGIAAIVNDEIITVLELNREYALALKGAEKRTAVSPAETEKLRREVLDALIGKILVKQKITELNIIVSEEEIRQSIEDIKKQNKLSQDALVDALLSQGITFDQYKAQMKDQLERLRLMSQEVKSKVQVSEQEIKAYYDANQAGFTDEEAYRARIIFLRLSKDSTPEEIRKVMSKLETAMAAAKSGGNFAELAKKYSDDANVQQDAGDLGFFKIGEMRPDIEKIVMTLKPGEIDKITTANGFYIIKLEEKRAGVVKPFETAKGQIEETLYRKKSEERFAAWVEELRKGAAVEIKP